MRQRKPSDLLFDKQTKDLALLKTPCIKSADGQICLVVNNMNPFIHNLLYKYSWQNVGLVKQQQQDNS